MTFHHLDTPMTFHHLWKPSATTGSRTLLMLHGTGGDESSLLDLGAALDPRASLLSVRGNVKEGYANRFFRRLEEGVFDLDDLHRQTNLLAEFLVEASATYAFGLEDLTAVGYSNGANIAASLLLSRPESLGGAILVRSMIPFDPGTTPNLVGKRILMLNGDRDPLVPSANAQSLERMFRAYGADVVFELLEAGHDFTRRDLDLARTWLGAE